MLAKQLQRGMGGAPGRLLHSLSLIGSSPIFSTKQRHNVVIIKTKIHGIWLDFLESEVKPCLSGVRQFYSDTEDSGYNTGLIYVDVDDNTEEALMLILSENNIDCEFDRGLRVYVEKHWGHRI